MSITTAVCKEVVRESIDENKILGVLYSFLSEGENTIVIDEGLKVIKLYAEAASQDAEIMRWVEQLDRLALSRHEVYKVPCLGSFSCDRYFFCAVARRGPDRLLLIRSRSDYDSVHSDEAVPEFLEVKDF